MNVLSALNNIYARREPERQWVRAVEIVKDMSEADIALSWNAFSAQIDCQNMAEAIITHSQYKSIFDGVVRDALLSNQPETESERTPTAPGSEIKSILNKYNSLVESQIQRAARLFVVHGGGHSDNIITENKYYDGAATLSNTKTASASEAIQPPMDNKNVISDSKQTEIEKYEDIHRKIEEIRGTVTMQMSQSSQQFIDIKTEIEKLYQTATINTVTKSIEAILDEKVESLVGQIRDSNTHLKDMKITIAELKFKQAANSLDQDSVITSIDSKVQIITEELNKFQRSLNTLDPKITCMELAITTATTTSVTSAANMNTSLIEFTEQIKAEVKHGMDSISAQQTTSMGTIDEKINELNEILQNYQEINVAELYNKLSSIDESLKTVSISTEKQISDDVEKAITATKNDGSGTQTESIITRLANSIKHNITSQLESISEDINETVLQYETDSDNDRDISGKSQPRAEAVSTGSKTKQESQKVRQFRRNSPFSKRVRPMPAKKSAREQAQYDREQGFKP